MKDSKRLFKIFYIAVASGIVLSVLLAMAFGSFTLSAVKVSNAMFILALVVCMTGAVRMLLPFFRLKSKLRKMKNDEQVDLTEAPKLKWEYPIIAAGILLVVLSYLLIFI